ncbi:TfoX/Sxy family protein [Methylobacterium tarhaniae]|uniref:TfoX/Sxy family protein n=1 Tax=Methylobacterium tarhaniae TaxID=1187852 RepID=UPI003D07DD73
MPEHADRAFLEEMLAPLGGVSIRRMFGGLGLFRDGLMFGLSPRGVLDLKPAPEETASFANEGGAPFSCAAAQAAARAQARLRAGRKAA